MKLQTMFAATLLCGTLAFSQMGPGRHGPPGSHQFGAGSGKLITGAPYSADVNSVSIKTLADGNSIQRTTTGHVARDSSGRTFTQETITGLWGQGGSKTVTFISDPAAGYVYTLNAETKIAVRRALHVHAPSDSSTETAKPARPNVVSADLGTQVMNGVNVQGKRVTHTIPAGEMGNTLPIVSTSETWLSTELHVVVANKRSDLREGTSTYSLNNIVRTAPAPALFQVPSDYTIKDASGFRH